MKVAAFYSAKMSSAQRNYPAHGRELLTGAETMLRHRGTLKRTQFTWVTDHKSLGICTTYLRRKTVGDTRWMEKLSEFDFTLRYVPG